MSRTPLVATGLALALAASATVSQAATWSDTSIGYRYGSDFREPGNPNKVRKNILQLTHASGYSLGQNFFNLDILQSDKKDPSSGDGSNGATEFYLVYRNQVHLSKVFDQSFAFGPVKDVAITAGFDLNTKNTKFAPRKRQILIGPTLKFDVPKGFVDLSLLYAKEWNHCGLGAPACPKSNITFDPYYQLNLTWGLPFNIGSIPMKFQGFAYQNGAKGRDYQNAKTTKERLVRASLMVDVGQMAWNQSNQLWAGVGFESWYHKFGNYKNNQGVKKAGINTDAPTLNLEWHF